jgi:hypothetical protein
VLGLGIAYHPEARPRSINCRPGSSRAAALRSSSACWPMWSGSGPGAPGRPRALDSDAAGRPR